MKELRPEEAWAKDIVAKHLGVSVHQHDFGGPSEHDLEIEYPDGQIGAVEVTAAADGEAIEWWNLMNGSDERWLEPNIRGGWAISVRPDSRVKELRERLPGLLAALESQRITSVDTRDWRKGHAAVDFARSLGITQAFQGGTDFPGSIYMTVDLPLERSGGMVPDSGDAVAEWIGEFLREPCQADVLSKLNRSGSQERHAFVILPGFTTAPFSVFDLLIRDDPPLPTAKPNLPAEVTHVWMVSTWSSDIGFYWAPEGGWAEAQKVGVPQG